MKQANDDKQFIDSSLVEEKKEETFEQEKPAASNVPKSEPRSRNTSGSNMKKPFKKEPRRSFLLSFALFLMHSILAVLFVGFVGVVCLHKINDDYLYPQLQLMKWIDAGRDFDELTYYHRVCDGSDVTATSVNELLISPNATTEETTMHMLKHGASMYPNLLTPETASALREFIDKENKNQKGWFVIQNDYRYSWGIDMNMHPAFQTYWKELASNEQLVNTLQSVIGPDPAVIEFTAITSSYGAVDQHDHQDVVPPGNAAKFARSFVPSYSLFIPLQDTTYEMGATHVCPGTHLCSEGCEEHCPAHNLAMSGDDIWPRGWGALVNQQTTHKGMGHTCKDCLDRIVLIATFAPRPQTQRKLETRMIGQGGSYSLKWNHWGNTFSDFAHAETRLTEIKKYLKSLGILKGNGWSWVSVASMRISNSEYGYNDAEEFMREGGFWFLPQSWQAFDAEQEQDENLWYTFLIETLKRTEATMQRLNMFAIVTCIVVVLFVDLYRSRSRVEPARGSLFLKFIFSLVLTHGLICLTGWLALSTVSRSNWAMDIRSGKAYNLPAFEERPEIDILPMTLPLKTDILLTTAYAADELGMYSKVVDVSHPGNLLWNNLVHSYADYYDDLSPTLKLHLCQSMVAWMQSERRFLTSNEYRQWQPITDAAVLEQFCQREFQSATSKLTQAMLRQVDSLRDDARNGRWRETAMQNRTTPQYLDLWETRFFSPHPAIAKKTVAKSNHSFRRLQRVQQQPPSTVNSVGRSKKSGVPPSPEAKEPYPGAWLQVGDVVEAMYGCQIGEWYRGKIVDAVSNEGTYSVLYDDGDIDDTLFPRCVRRFVAYEIDENVEVRPEDDGVWYEGSIVNVKAGNLYDVEVEEGPVFHNLPQSALRRRRRHSVENIVPGIGMKVLARFDEGDQYYSGIIVADNGDGTFSIQYDDGDFESSVKARMIEWMDESS